MLTFSIHAETPLQASPTYSKSTLRRTTGGNTYYLGPLPTDQHSQNNTRMPEKITLRSNSRNATRSVHDLLQPVASKKIPAGLTGKVAWTSYTYFIIRPMQFFSSTTHSRKVAKCREGTLDNFLGSSRTVPRTPSNSSSI